MKIIRSWVQEKLKTVGAACFLEEGVPQGLKPLIIAQVVRGQA